MVKTTTHDLRTTGQGDMRDISGVVASAVAEFDTRPRNRQVVVQLVGE